MVDEALSGLESGLLASRECDGNVQLTIVANNSDNDSVARLFALNDVLKLIARGNSSSIDGDDSIGLRSIDVSSFVDVRASPFSLSYFFKAS
jgi:hypothetical protein